MSDPEQVRILIDNEISYKRINELKKHAAQLIGRDRVNRITNFSNGKVQLIVLLWLACFDVLIHKIRTPNGEFLRLVRAYTRLGYSPLFVQLMFQNSFTCYWGCEVQILLIIARRIYYEGAQSRQNEKTFIKNVFQLVIFSAANENCEKRKRFYSAKRNPLSYRDLVAEKSPGS